MGFVETGDTLTYGWAAVLGIIQGLTEFLPVSSSGHLALAQHVGMQQPMSVSFDILLHLATVFVVLGAFAGDILRFWREERIVLAYVILGSIPTALIGLALKDHFEALRESPYAVCTALLVTSLFLVALEKRGVESNSIGKASPLHILLIGLAQSLAITPGISRSGSTIATAGLLGIRRSNALTFSFLLMVPAVLGAALLKSLKNPEELASMQVGPCAIGFFAAAVSGYFALKALIHVVQQHKLIYFAAYCGLLSLTGFIYFGIFRT